MTYNKGSHVGRSSVSEMKTNPLKADTEAEHGKAGAFIGCHCPVIVGVGAAW